MYGFGNQVGAGLIAGVGGMDCIEAKPRWVGRRCAGPRDDDEIRVVGFPVREDAVEALEVVASIRAPDIDPDNAPAWASEAQNLVHFGGEAAGEIGVVIGPEPNDNHLRQ